MRGTVKELLTRETVHTEKELDNFFHPIVDQINTTVERGQGGFLSDLTLVDFNNYFWPFVSKSNSVSSLMLSELSGKEKMLLQLDTIILNRESDPNRIDGNARISEWRVGTEELVLNRRYEEAKGL